MLAGGLRLGFENSMRCEPSTERTFRGFLTSRERVATSPPVAYYLSRRPAVPHPSEEILDLIQRAKAGEEAAWDRLFSIYDRDLQKRVRATLGPELRAQLDDSVDVMQSVWLEAYRSIKSFKYQGDGSFLAWVAAIARHKIANKASKSRKRGRPVGGTEGIGILSASPTDKTGVNTALEKKEDLELLRGALQKLKEPDREILRLSWFEGLKHREIG